MFRANLCQWAAAGLLIPSLLGSAPAPAVKRLLILAPHEDDEVLGCAGVIEAAVHRGDRVRVAVATNGDFTGAAAAPVRIRETLQATKFLGVPAAHVDFLGYGDGTLNLLYHAAGDDTVVASHAAVATYAAPPLAFDYHFREFGTHAPYTRGHFRADLAKLIAAEQPTDIYVTGLYDAHPDHAALFQFAIDAVTEQKRQDPGFAPVVHQYLIHASTDDRLWPQREQSARHLPAFSPPENFAANTAWDWSTREDVPVPKTMRPPPISGTNRKFQAIQLYPSQEPDHDHEFLHSFVRADEVFFPIDMANLAPLAQITASSENLPQGQPAAAVADGKIDGAPRFPGQEWGTLGEGQGAWLAMHWSKPQQISRVVLFDRPNPEDHILAATLLFSDGSRVAIGPLPNDGRALSLRFKPRRSQWLRLEIDAVSGSHTGLAELQVYSGG